MTRRSTCAESPGRRWAGLLLLAALGSAGLWAMPSLSAAAQSPDPGSVHDAQAEQVLGNWLTAEHDGIIQISQAPDGLYEGRIVGGDSPKDLDVHNPDPARRNQLLLGQVIMRGLHYDGAGRWSGGTVYDPDTGHTYHCRLQLLGADRLRVRGFLGLSLIGRSQVWTRYTGRSMVLPAP